MPPLLELVHIRKRFGQVVIATDVSISIEAGATLGIVGPNGAGKTTLFGMISGDVRPDSGEVIYDGTVVNHLDAGARCRLGIGRTYQVPRPFDKMTVFENVLVAAQQGGGLRGAKSYEAALEALDATNLSEDPNRLAAGLGLLARKRLEVARALATQPHILLLDEVAGGLTDPEVLELVAIVRAASERGIAIVWIEHVVRALVATVERLICLAGGEIIGDGTPHEVLAHPAVREVYLGTDTGAEDVA